jgi:hypothetical protein
MGVGIFSTGKFSTKKLAQNVEGVNVNVGPSEGNSVGVAESINESTDVDEDVDLNAGMGVSW